MRTLNAKLKEYIDARMPKRTNETPEEILILAAYTMIGITEEDAPEIVDLIRSTITKPWGEAWCVDFAQTCIAYVEELTGQKSNLIATEGVLDLWNHSPDQRDQDPKPGDLIIWRMKNTEHGHCGIVTNVGKDLLGTIEGNTSGADAIDRMGRGVHEKNRLRSGGGSFEVLGFLRVFA